MPTPFWLYRIGRMELTRYHMRAFWGETWVTLQPDLNTATNALFLTVISNLYIQPFGNFVGSPAYSTRTFVNQLYPFVQQIIKPVDFTFGSSLPAPPIAREAGFRLQRVGGLTALGRYSPPIPNDSFYTDLPHRRHVNTSLLQSWIDGTRTNPAYFTQTWNGRTYTNVIFHRKTKTWTPVTAHRIMPNPVRYWERLKDYDPTAHESSDLDFCPPERKLFGT